MHDVWGRFYKQLSWLLQVVTRPPQYFTFIRKPSLNLCISLPDFFSFYDDDRVCFNFQHKVRSSISVVDRSDSRVGTSNHAKLGYMRVLNIFSRSLWLFQLNVYLSISRIASTNWRQNSGDQTQLLISLSWLIVFPLLNFQDHVFGCLLLVITLSLFMSLPRWCSIAKVQRR